MSTSGGLAANTGLLAVQLVARSDIHATVNDINATVRDAAAPGRIRPALGLTCVCYHVIGNCSVPACFVSSASTETVQSKAAGQYLPSR